MLYEVTKESGNLLLNIGPKADGTIPEEAIEPLEAVGKWVKNIMDFIWKNGCKTDNLSWNVKPYLLR